MLVTRKSTGLRGTLRPPGDKSISHRAAIFGALADGRTAIDNFLEGADCLATLECLRRLGVAIEHPGAGEVIVHGHGLDALQEPGDILDASNSGTTMRLLCGVLASRPFFSVITGDSSLRHRPMARVIEPLSAMGASISSRSGNRFPPLAIYGGALRAISYSLPVASAQVKSAVILAALAADGTTEVIEPAPSRDHTERMLGALGADIATDGNRITVRPGRLNACDITVPGDISSAAFFIVAATLVPESDITIVNVGVNPTRSGIIDVLMEMGADIQVVRLDESGPEPIADLRVRTAPLCGVEVKGDLIPRLIDEIPILALAMASARGPSVIRDAAELKHKESNRLATTAAELARLGAEIRQTDDGLAINGDAALTGTVCESYGDHRIAMTAAIAGLIAEGRTSIADDACVSVSYPQFASALKELTEE